jgi:hypothetical protein
MSYWRSEERRRVRPNKQNNLVSIFFSKFIGWGGGKVFKIFCICTYIKATSFPGAYLISRGFLAINS